MRYWIMWKSEVVDETNSLTNARYLKREYNMAYRGGVTIYDSFTGRTVN